MLDDKSRVILFWFSIAMIVVVVIVALTTLLRAWGGPLSEESTMVVDPAEISLCLGEQRQFTVKEIEQQDAEITWRTTGGTISESSGLATTFTADGEPGDYVITAISKGPRQVADATVHVAACTPTPTPTPTSIPTLTPIPSPTSVPTPVPTPTPALDDARGDVSVFEGGAPVEGAPAGVDLRIASVGLDLRVNLRPVVRVPVELVDWVDGSEVLLWFTFYEPVLDPPAYSDWLFVLDLDGDAATGRPAGSARINPDLGDEAVLGVLYDPALDEYQPYFLVWDSAQGAWADGPEGIRFYMNESRTVIGLALPSETLSQAALETGGVTLAPGAVRGRAAALSLVGGEMVVDFYPDRP